MNEASAREILKSYIRPDGSLFKASRFLAWSPKENPTGIDLDGEFPVEELEAIIWWVKEHKEPSHVTPD